MEGLWKMIENWLALYLCISKRVSITDAVSYMETGRMTKRIRKASNLLEKDVRSVASGCCLDEGYGLNTKDESSDKHYRFNTGEESSDKYYRFNGAEDLEDKDSIVFGHSKGNKKNNKKEDIAEEPAKVTKAMPLQKIQYNYSTNILVNI